MKFWLTILIQLALAGIELLVKMMNRRLDAKEKARKEAEAAAQAAASPNPYAGAEPPADFREELLGQVKRLQETTRSFRKKPTP